MTPQEKAKELVDRFRGELKYGQRHWGQVHYAKQCATIAADEVLEADLPGYPSQKEYDEFVKFWTSVKEEIQKL
jgi:hypothetical protein